MQTKTTNKLWALALSLIMLLTLIPLSAFTFSTTASAAGASHVLNASELQNFNNKGDIPEGKTFEVDNGYFTIYCGKDARFDKSEKTFDDGFVGTQRINFNGGIDTATPAKCIGFKTSGAATVKVWWVVNDAGREVVIQDASGKNVDITSAGQTKGTINLSTLKVPAAGQYFLGATPKSNYIFKVEVTEETAAKEYVLDADTLEVKSYANVKDQKAGTDNYFTIDFGGKGKVEDKGKAFPDEYAPKNDINFDGKTTLGEGRDITFTTADKGQVKIWWISGDNGRQVYLYKDGTEVAKSTDSVKNTTYISTFDIPSAGTYKIAGTDGKNLYCKVVVTEGEIAEAVRADWSKVADPAITSVTQNKNEEGKLTDDLKVTVKAVVGSNGGDAVKVLVTDKDGKEVATKQSLAEKDSHDILVPISKSGTYTVKATLVREGEKDKESAAATGEFKLTLKAPTIASVTNKGNGKVSVKWDKVDEATGYVVYAAGKEVKSDTNSATVDGLKVGDKVEFTVAAVRGSETGDKSAPLTASITADEQQEWGFTAYGTSTGSSKNKYEGNLNEGKVTVIAQGGAGKLNLAADDGYSFYYTAVPANKNFTFRAKIHVDEWTYSNGQEGFGIAAVDMLPEKSFDTSHWTNFYMASVGRFSPFKAQQGVGVMAKVGITPENWQAVKDNAFDRTKLYAARAGEALDEHGATATSNYNIVGNVTNPDALAAKNIKTVEELVDFDLEITKNNTGFFMSYYKDGKLVKTVKHWGTEDLSQLDKDNIYVGIVAARNATVSLKNTDYSLEIRDPSKDPAPEAKPVTYVTPSISIESGSYGNSTSYDLLLRPSHKGTVTVKVNGAVVADNKVVGDKLDSDGNIVETILPITIKSGKNPITVDYKADETADLGESVKFDKTTASANVTVDYNTYFAKQENIYVAPNAKSGNGGKDSPYDLATALTLARPGQKIILKEGTYKTKNRLQVPREVDGTKDAMIYLMADPEAKTRPVLDFEGSTGIGLQILGDYWYLKGFDVTHAGNNGLRIDGNYCVADQIHAYYNYGTGISIQMDSKFSREIWPTYNTIKNCDAYYNADSGEEDADGFSAKFCIGVGNVFDNCVAYGNADDGWDLYGRNYPMEAVTVQNCVAYKNGYREDGTRGKGNGNGFKLGGDNNAARHMLINSVSFMNGADGITNNSNPNIIVKDCISYKNDKGGVNLYTKAGNTDFESAGVISYKNGSADTFDPKGSQDVKKVDQTYWNGANGVADDWFKSLEFSGKVARKADGSIDMQGFLELTDKAPKNAGARMEGVKSGEVTITPDTVLPNPATGNAALPVTFGVLALAGAAVFVISKKRKN